MSGSLMAWKFILNNVKRHQVVGTILLIKYLSIVVHSSTNLKAGWHFREESEILQMMTTDDER